MTVDTGRAGPQDIRSSAGVSDTAEAKPAVETDQPGRRPKATSLRPLSRLLPFLFRYRAQIGIAVLFLILAAASTLVVPVAVRRVIDNGFSGENAAFVDQYFSVMMFVVAVLAVSSAGALLLRHLDRRTCCGGFARCGIFAFVEVIPFVL